MLCTKWFISLRRILWCKACLCLMYILLTICDTIMIRLPLGIMAFLSLIKTQHFSPNCKRTVCCIEKCHIPDNLYCLDKSCGIKHFSVCWIFCLQKSTMYDKVAFMDNGLLVMDINNTFHQIVSKLYVIEKCHIPDDLSDLDEYCGIKHFSVWWIFQLENATMYDDKVAFSDNGLVAMDQNTTLFTKL